MAAWKISNGHISATGHPVHFMFGSSCVFSRSADRMAVFLVGLNPPSWKFSNGHISGTGHPIDFVFDPRVGFSGTADQMDLLPVRPNPRSRPSAVLHNFEWPYLRNSSSGPIRIWF